MLCPTSGLYVFEAQSSHSVAPLVDVNVPTGHELHSVELKVDVYFPVSHAVQVLFGFRYVPGEQRAEARSLQTMHRKSKRKAPFHMVFDCSGKRFGGRRVRGGDRGRYKEGRRLTIKGSLDVRRGCCGFLSLFLFFSKEERRRRVFVFV